MLAKAFWEDRSKTPVVKYAPGDEIPDKHPKRAWLLRSGIAVDATEQQKEEAREPVEDVTEEPTQEAEAEAEEPEAPAETDDKKPLPTDSVEAHRAYLKSRKVDTKGLTRAQMIKVIAGLDD